MGYSMKANALPKIKQAEEQILIQAARTLMAVMEQRDFQLNRHCGRVADNCADAKTLEAIAQEVKTTIDDLQNVI